MYLSFPIGLCPSLVAFIWLFVDIVRLMTSISKGKNTPIVLKDKISRKSELVNYAFFFRLSSLPKSVASYYKRGDKSIPYKTESGDGNDLAR